jgi:arylsulfatase A-like enzyme
MEDESLMRRSHPAWTGFLMGWSVGALTGALDILVRVLHPSLGFGASATLAIVALYGAWWSLLGFFVGLLTGAARGYSWRWPFAVSASLSFIALVGGYVNFLVLPSLDDPTSVAFDLALVSLGIVGAFVLLRVLPRWSDERVRQRAAGFLLIVLALATALSKPRPTMRGTEEVGTRNKPDILIVPFDALRADHMSAYGYHRRTTPAVEEFAREATLFLNPYAQSSWTRPSVATLFTGVQPATHQCHTVPTRLPEALVTLPEVLRENGYRTAVIARNALVSSAFGYGRGVDMMLTERPGPSGQTILGHILRQGSKRTSVLSFAFTSTQWFNALDLQPDRLARDDDIPGALFEWIDGLHGESYFAYLHFLSPHSPYACPASPSNRFRSAFAQSRSATIPPRNHGIAPSAASERPPSGEVDALIANYDQCVAYADSLFEQILVGLERRNLLQKTAIFLLSDHGEEFGELGTWGHGHSLHEGVIRVPLILSLPLRVRPGARVSKPVRLLDVPPTVLDLAGLPIPQSFQGASLLKAVEDEKPSKRTIWAEIEYGPWLRSDALLVDAFKLIATQSGGKDSIQLFDLSKRSAEGRDVAALDPMRASAMRKTLEAMQQEAAMRRVAVKNAVIDPDTKERLRALGYLPSERYSIFEQRP